MTGWRLRQFCVILTLLFLLPSPFSSHLAAQDDRHQHVLFQAILRGDDGRLRDALRRGAPPDLRDDDDSTPLMHAALHGSAQMVATLLAHGADAKASNKHGVTALLWGAADVEKARLLLDHGADPRAKTQLGNSPLSVAAASPRGTEAVKLLLARGGDDLLEQSGGRKVLRRAVEAGNLETVRLLVTAAGEAGRKQSLLGNAGNMVTLAANGGHHDIVKFLLDNGVDPNAESGSRGNSLSASLMAGRPEIARTLITRGAQLDRRVDPGNVPTAVFAAYLEWDDCSVARLLKQQEAELGASNDEQQTALTWARMRGHQELIDALVDAGVDEGRMPARPDIPSRDVDLDGENRAKLIVAAVRKSVDLLQLSSDTFLKVRGNCVSCHHQNLPGVALAWAGDRGFPVRRDTVETMIERQERSWQPRVRRAYEMDSPFPVPPRFLGYGMWSFGELGYRPNELTRAVSWYLAATQQPDGRWVPGMLRPPLGDDEILSTMLGMRSLQLYPLPGRARETEQRIEHAREWLASAQPRTRQQRAYRMLGLSWAGTEPDELKDETRTLLAEQREDGGWAQLPGLASDAWATGQTLVVLRVAGGVAADDPAYRRGMEFLLSTQFEDGSWFVQSRSWPFQPYFESKFPFGRDQWISAPATAWAVMALCQAVSPEEVKRIVGPENATASESDKAATAAKPSPPRALPAAAEREVDFARDIRPLLVRSCLSCHGEEEPESNLSLTSRQGLLRGGDSELPSIVPGAAGDSPLLRFAAGLVQDMEMPPLDARDKFPALSDAELSLLRAWIEQGAKWSDDEN